MNAKKLKYITLSIDTLIEYLSKEQAKGTKNILFDGTIKADAPDNTIILSTKPQF